MTRVKSEDKKRGERKEIARYKIIITCLHKKKKKKGECALYEVMYFSFRFDLYDSIHPQLLRCFPCFLNERDRRKVKKAK